MARRSLTEMGFASQEPSITEVAKQLGISVSTVSRALRNLPGVREATRKRILKVAKEIGYEPSDRSTPQKRPVNILALSLGVGSKIDNDFLSGISNSAVELGYNVTYHLYRPGQEELVLDPRSQPRALASGEIDAIILMHRWESRIVAELKRLVPIVSIVHQYPGLDIDVIKSNDSQGIDSVVRHYLDKNCRKIGFYGACREMSWARARLGAFVESIEMNNLEFDPAVVVRVTLEEALAVNVYENSPSFDKALALARKGVKAWVCSSQLTAASLLNFFLKKGFAVPADIKVAGYHGTPEPTVLGLPILTSTDATSEEIGAAALRRVQHRLGNSQESMRIIELPCTLLPGATS